MSDQSLEIKISTPTELAGVQELSTRLEKQIGAAKALGENYDELSKKLAAAKAMMAAYTQQTKQASEAEAYLAQVKKDVESSVVKSTGVIGDNSKATDQAAVKQKNLRDAVQGVGAAFPEAGRLFGLFINPITAGVALAAYVVGQFRSAFVELNKQLAEHDAAQRFAESMRNQASAIEAADIALATYNETVNNSQTAMEKAKGAYDKYVSAVRARGQLGDELDAAKKARELAMLDEDEAKGKITAVQAATGRVGIEARYAKRADERKAEMQAKELNAAIQKRAFLVDQRSKVAPQIPSMQEQAEQDNLDAIAADREAKGFETKADLWAKTVAAIEQDLANMAGKPYNIAAIAKQKEDLYLAKKGLKSANALATQKRSLADKKLRSARQSMNAADAKKDDLTALNRDVAIADESVTGLQDDASLRAEFEPQIQAQQDQTRASKVRSIQAAEEKRKAEENRKLAEEAIRALHSGGGENQSALRELRDAIIQSKSQDTQIIKDIVQRVRQLESRDVNGRRD